MTATGKYPYISVDDNIISFDPLLVGKKATKEIYVKNCS